jgi:hypothetical protein
MKKPNSRKSPKWGIFNIYYAYLTNMCSENALVTNSAEFLTDNFRNRCFRCDLTVSFETCNSFAISLDEQPKEINFNTSNSLFEMQFISTN